MAFQYDVINEETNNEEEELWEDQILVGDDDEIPAAAAPQPAFTYFHQESQLNHGVASALTTFAPPDGDRNANVSSNEGLVDRYLPPVESNPLFVNEAPQMQAIEALGFQEPPYSYQQLLPFPYQQHQHRQQQSSILLSPQHPLVAAGSPQQLQQRVAPSFPMPGPATGSSIKSDTTTTPNQSRLQQMLKIAVGSSNRSRSPAKELSQILKVNEEKNAAPLISLQFNPVNEKFICWNGHDMEEMDLEVRLGEEDPDAKIWCDNCACRLTMKPKGFTVSPSSGKSRAVSPGAFLKYSTILHCRKCQSDVCGSCRVKTMETPKTNRSCYRCSRCGLFSNSSNVNDHVCRRQKSLSSTNTTTNGKKLVGKDSQTVIKKEGAISLDEVPKRASGHKRRSVPAEIPKEPRTKGTAGDDGVVAFRGKRGRETSTEKKKKTDAPKPPQPPPAPMMATTASKKRGNGAFQSSLSSSRPAAEPSGPPGSGSVAPGIGSASSMSGAAPPSRLRAPKPLEQHYLILDPSASPSIRSVASEKYEKSKEVVAATLVVAGVPRLCKLDLIEKFLTVEGIKTPPVLHMEEKRRFYIDFSSVEEAGKFVTAANGRLLQGVRPSWSWRDP